MGNSFTYYGKEPYITDGYWYPIPSLYQNNLTQIFRGLNM